MHVETTGYEPPRGATGEFINRGPITLTVKDYVAFPVSGTAVTLPVFEP